MPTDYSRLKSTLANSKTQVENNALYQTVLGTIEGSKEAKEAADASLAAAQAAISELMKISVVELDTSGGPVSVALSDYLTGDGGLVIFKDISGNASSSNITLEGACEGVTDPVINTDYGVFHGFLGNDGLFHTW